MAHTAAATELRRLLPSWGVKQKPVISWPSSDTWMPLYGTTVWLRMRP